MLITYESTGDRVVRTASRGCGVTNIGMPVQRDGVGAYSRPRRRAPRRTPPSAATTCSAQLGGGRRTRPCSTRQPWSAPGSGDDADAAGVGARAGSATGQLRGRPKVSRVPCSTSRGTSGVEQLRQPGPFRSAGQVQRKGSGRPRPTAPSAVGGPAGDPRPGAPPAGDQRQPGPDGGRGPPPRPASQASSSSGGATATRRPADAPRLLEAQDASRPRSGSRRASATRSGASTPPPAPCPRTSRATGAPASLTWNRPGPCGVATSTTGHRGPALTPAVPATVGDLAASALGQRLQQLRAVVLARC